MTWPTESINSMLDAKHDILDNPVMVNSQIKLQREFTFRALEYPINIH